MTAAGGARPIDAWPRGAALMSVVIALVGLALVMAALGVAGDRGGGMQTGTAVLAVVGTLAAFVFLRACLNSWFTGGSSPGLVLVSVVISLAGTLVAIVLLAVPATRPLGLGLLGGLFVGLMVANIGAIRRARRLS